MQSIPLVVFLCEKTWKNVKNPNGRKEVEVLYLFTSHNLTSNRYRYFPQLHLLSGFPGRYPMQMRRLDGQVKRSEVKWNEVRHEKEAWKGDNAYPT